MSEAKEKKSRPIRLTVTSDKMNKSRTGVTENIVKHAEYGKYQKRRTKFMYHDEKNESKAGDIVLVTATRPLSSRKKFTLLKIVRKAAE
jgi:small subunit ribosomal protein S17